MPPFLLLLLTLLWLIPAQPVGAQDFFDQIPEVLVPEPHGQIKTRTGSFRVPMRVDGEDLPDRLSSELSTACSKSQFNQDDQGSFHVIVPYEDGPPRRYGYADGSGKNLRDAKRLGRPNRVYLFVNDGTSDCRVYDLARQF